MKKKISAPEICPVCGEDVPARARACPECGADENSGWKPDALASDGLDLPESEFNYDEFVAEEFGNGKGRPQVQLLWVLAAVALFIALVVSYFIRL